MAVDTRNKRASCIGVGLSFLRVRPLADGDLANVADRRHIALCYPGLAAVATPVFGPGLVTGYDYLVNTVALSDRLVYAEGLSDA